MQLLQKDCQKADVGMVAFSVDPKNDTAEVLLTKAKELNADPQRWKFLTGTPQTAEDDKIKIYRLIRDSFQMPVTEAVGPDLKPGFEVLHSNNLIYVDANGHPRAKYNAMDDTDMAKLRAVIQGKAQPVETEAPQPAPGTVTIKNGGEVVFKAPDSVPSDADEAAEPSAEPKLPVWVQRLPTVNASLNALATVLLIAGGILVKRRQLAAHKQVMLAAFGVSILFLASYLVYHSFHYTKKFSGTGASLLVYRTILFSHIILAITVPFLAIATIRRGLRAEREQADIATNPDPAAALVHSAASWERHRRLAWVTYPIWLYVSVTGVIIYFMLYHWPAGM